MCLKNQEGASGLRSRATSKIEDGQFISISDKQKIIFLV